MYYFIYKVKFSNREETIQEAGAGFADSYAEAAQKIEDYYGPDLLGIEGIFFLDESPLITFPSTSTYNELFNANLLNL